MRCRLNTQVLHVIVTKIAIFKNLGQNTTITTNRLRDLGCLCKPEIRHKDSRRWHSHLEVAVETVEDQEEGTEGAFAEAEGVVVEVEVSHSSVSHCC